MNKNTRELILQKETYLLNYNNTIKYFSEYNLDPHTHYLQEEDKEHYFDFEVKNKKEHSLGKFITDTFSKADFFQYIKYYLNLQKFSNVLYLVKLNDDAKIDFPRWNIAQNKQQIEKADIKIVLLSFGSNGTPIEETLYFSSVEYSPETYINDFIEPPKEINYIEEITNHFENEHPKLKPTYIINNNEVVAFDFEIISKNFDNKKVLISYFDEKTTLFEIKDRIKKCFLLQEQEICNSFLVVTDKRETLRKFQQELFKFIKNKGDIKIINDKDSKPIATIVFATATISELKLDLIQNFHYKQKESEGVI